MKKILSILAISLAFLLAACQSTQKYSFTANWTADGRYQEQTEILEYTVTHKKESIRFPSENGSVYGGTENENCEITYGPGTYTVTMETSPSLPASVEDPREQGSSARIYRVRTELNVPVVFLPKGDAAEEKTHDDVIVSESYFLDENHNLQPFYSRQEVESSAYSAEYSIYRYTAEAKYSGGTVRLTVSAEDEATMEAFHMTENTLVKEFSYQEGAVLDNGMLLFAVRGMSPSDSFTGYYNVFDASAMELMSLSVSVKETTPVSKGWTYNDAVPGADETVQTYALSIQRYGSANTGFPKICYYQIKSDENTREDNRCFLVRFVNPLTITKGYLQYDLKKATVTVNQ